MQHSPIPKGANDIHLTIRKIKVKGSTIFSDKEFAELYKPYLGKDATLDKLWLIAQEITDLYRQKGYFLSKAYVPKQHIENGDVEINVVEGYIGKVELDEKTANQYIIKQLIARLTSYKPISSNELETILLTLNDLPGISFRAILSAAEHSDTEDGIVKLTLIPTPKAPEVNLAFDNYLSKYIGPHEFIASLKTQVLPLQDTVVTTLASTHLSNLKYFVIDHDAYITPELSLDINAGTTTTKPSYTLKAYNIRGSSYFAGVNFNYQFIRLRQQSLGVKFGFDTKNVSNDVLGVQLSKDKLRRINIGANFNNYDSYNGMNALSLTIYKGVQVLAASKKGDSNLSRANANPQFLKSVISASRIQSLPQGITLIGSSLMQLSASDLPSSEEFGYGGQSFGRAFDSSEIIGDNGISASIEARFNNVPSIQVPHLSLVPYTFIDAGRTWNHGASRTATAASVGLGMRFGSDIDFTGNIGLAFPLIKKVSTPIYGGSERAPRILLQFNQRF
jgi:hemolysin activation/secretion protein